MIAIAAPPLVLAGVGVTHPMHLTAQSAAYWRAMHIGLIVVFPLLGLAPWLVLRTNPHASVRWAAALLGYLYATFYSALDVLAGVGAGGVKANAGGNRAVETLFGLGNALATVGVYAYLAASVLAAGGVLVKARSAAVPGAVLVVAAAVSFLDSHIYWPRGVLTMIALALGWMGLVWADARHPRAAEGRLG